jgi:hypothetical protein
MEKANDGYEEVKGPPKTVDADEAPKDQEPLLTLTLTPDLVYMCSICIGVEIDQGFTRSDCN